MTKPAKVRDRVLVALLAIRGVPIVQAQVIPLINPKYFETFSNPKVSGNLLVGLSWSPPKERVDANAKFDPLGVGIFLLPALRGQTACVEVASQDGRYFAQNLYQFPNEQGLEFFQTKTIYPTPLQEYPASEMAASVRLVRDDCNSTERGVLIPAVFANRHPNGPVTDGTGQRLVALLNADLERLRKVSIRKKSGDSETIESTCSTKSKAVRISFSSSCEFEALPPGDYVLVVLIQERFELVKHDFEVFLRR